MTRCYNFCAGPASLPEPVLEKARDEMLDWHGKGLSLMEMSHRSPEVVGVAESEHADLVLHSGDLFDRPLPPVEALQLALNGLLRLAAGGRRPVVVVAGNHDSPGLFEALAPLLVGFGVHVVGRIKAPEAGGVVILETAGGPVHVACFPFLRAAQTVDFTDRADTWYGAYAERVRRITETYAAAVAARAGGHDVGVLVGHWMVGGVKVRTGAPRGERELHMGEAYSATGASVPTGLDYVALGHIHAPQPVPGAQVPAEYAGSLLQLDFGEAGEEKRVVIVDVAPTICPSTETFMDVTRDGRTTKPGILTGASVGGMDRRPDSRNISLAINIAAELGVWTTSSL